jgi:hypothetical protein
MRLKNIKKKKGKKKRGYFDNLYIICSAKIFSIKS